MGIAVVHKDMCSFSFSLTHTHTHICMPVCDEYVNTIVQETLDMEVVLFVGVVVHV